jgi:hypothetical protein
MEQEQNEMTPGELASRIGAYFAECLAQDAFPDRANMILYLGLSPDVFLRYEENEDEQYAPFADILKKARLRREGWLSRVMFSDKNRAQSAIFQLRQPINGGYSDKQEMPGGLNIRLKVNGGIDLLD